MDNNSLQRPLVCYSTFYIHVKPVCYFLAHSVPYSLQYNKSKKNFFLCTTQRVGTQSVSGVRQVLVYYTGSHRKIAYVHKLSIILWNIIFQENSSPFDKVFLMNKTVVIPTHYRHVTVYKNVCVKAHEQQILTLTTVKNLFFLYSCNVVQGLTYSIYYYHYYYQLRH